MFTGRAEGEETHGLESWSTSLSVLGAKIMDGMVWVGLAPATHATVGRFGMDGG